MLVPDVYVLLQEEPSESPAPAEDDIGTTKDSMKGNGAKGGKKGDVIKPSGGEQPELPKSKVRPITKWV